MPEKKQKRIVIIGGGFGGVYAAKRLLKYFGNKAQITLINKSNYFLFIPMLHEVATGNLCGHNLAEPIRNLLYGKNFEFVRGTVLSVDLKEQLVKTEDSVIPYDDLVLSTGSTTNFFGIAGAQENCLTLKNLEEANAIKRSVIDAIERSFKVTDKKLRERLATVAVIGAGPTGVELAIEMKEFLDQMSQGDARVKEHARVLLIQRGPHILPQTPELRKEAEKAIHEAKVTLLANSTVKSVEPGKVILDDGTTFEASTLIWTAGVKTSLFQTVPQITSERGSVITNEYLQLPNFSNVFAIGDCTMFTPLGKKEMIPWLAQVASEMGKHVAQNVYLREKGEPMKPFDYKLKGQFLSLGKGDGVGVVYGLKVRGFIAWWLNRTVYLAKIPGTGNKLRTAWEWTLNLFTKRYAAQN